MPVGEVLGMISASIHLFSEERQRYYANKEKELLEIIAQVEDSTYYEKDMEAKGQAERQLKIDGDALRKEWIKDILQVKAS